MAARDASDTIVRAVSSLLAQDSQAWRLIIVNDNSTDDTGRIADTYALSDARITAIHGCYDGTGSARNTALPVIGTEFVTYLDADDEFEPEYLRNMLKFVVERPGYDIYSCDGLFVYDASPPEPVFDYADVREVTLDDLLERCWILGGGALVRTELMAELEGYNATRYGEDYDLWLRALAQGARHIATPQLLYRYHRSVPNQKSEDGVAGVHSKMMAFADLLDSGLLSRAQALNVCDQLDHYFRSRVPLTAAESAKREVLARQGDLVKARITRLLGRERGGRFIRLLQRVSAKTLPFRAASLGLLRREQHEDSRQGSDEQE